MNGFRVRSRFSLGTSEYENGGKIWQRVWRRLFRRSPRLDQARTGPGFSGFDGRAASHGCDPTESLIGGNQHTDLAELSKIKSEGQLQGVQGAKTF